MTHDHDSQNATNKGLPSLKSLILDAPLYESFQIDKFNDYHTLMQLIVGAPSESIDAFCGKCQQASVFLRSGGQDLWNRRNPQPSTNYPIGELVANRQFELHFFCSRSQVHKMVFHFHIENEYLTKIGQSPSLADLHLPDLRKYRKVLNKERYQEFVKGVGLASHGVGIGSFAYLRRIFESLIEEATEVERQTPTWNEAEFLKLRMAEKIFRLKHQLPEFLVQNRSLYSILSAGLHTLEEQACLAHFPVVKTGIEFILDQKLYRLEQDEKMATAKKAIEQVASQVKPSS